MEIGRKTREMAKAVSTMPTETNITASGKKISRMAKVIGGNNVLGVYDYANGDKYDGTWNNDVREGLGIWV